MHYLLYYEKSGDYAERQKPYLDSHREHLDRAVERGELILAGSLQDPVDGSALLVFKGDSEAAAEKFAREDPYVIEGIISKWWIRRWDTVRGTALG